MKITAIKIKASGRGSMGSVYEIILKFDTDKDYRNSPRYWVPFHEVRELAGGIRGDSFTKVSKWLNTAEGIEYTTKKLSKYLKV